MKHKFFLVSCIVILLLGCSVFSNAEVVLLEDFDNDLSNWTVVPRYASGLDYTIDGSELVVENIETDIMNPESGEVWATVTLKSQDFDFPLSDFSIEFQFSWSSDDHGTGEQSVRAMQGIYIEGYDTNDVLIARAGFFDPWVSYKGKRAGRIIGGEQISTSQDELDFSGSATINISRIGDEVVIAWDEEQLAAGTNAESLQSVGILFYYYPYNGVGGPSYFGTETVALVSVEGEPITSCPPDKPQECSDGTCCGADEICCNGECCLEGYVCSSKGCSIPFGGECPTEEIYDEYSEEVELLRKYRDEVLVKTAAGQKIIRLYYLWTPVIVRAMEEDKTFREELKKTIDEILPMIREEVE